MRTLSNLAIAGLLGMVAGCSGASGPPPSSGHESGGAGGAAGGATDGEGGGTSAAGQERAHAGRVAGRVLTITQKAAVSSASPMCNA